MGGLFNLEQPWTLSGIGAASRTMLVFKETPVSLNLGVVLQRSPITLSWHFR